MRRILLTCLILITSLSVYSQMQKGRSSMGYSAGYTSVTKNGVLSIDYRYNLTKALRISPSVTGLIKKEEYKGWVFDANMHYVLPVAEVFAVYPLVGVSYSLWDYYIKKTKSYGPGESYLGANIGLGAEVYVVDELLVGVEMKYNKIKKHDQVFVALRIAYQFMQ